MNMIHDPSLNKGDGCRKLKAIQFMKDLERKASGEVYLHVSVE